VVKWACIVKHITVYVPNITLSLLITHSHANLNTHKFR